MFADHIVTTDELYATGATFTVLAWGFAYVFLATEIVWPDSFPLSPTRRRHGVVRDALPLGHHDDQHGPSDIVPIRPHARSVVMIEQIAGMLYLALVVARMIALTVRRPRPRHQGRLTAFTAVGP